MDWSVCKYADDIVLIAPSWKGLQKLISLLHEHSGIINLTCNVDKTVCMSVPPKRYDKVISQVFPTFKLGNIHLKYVQVFNI